MALRNILEQYPSHQLCRSKINELDGRITTFQLEKTKLQAEAANPKRIEGINEEISALAELRGCVHALLDYMHSTKADLSGAESEYGQILRELMVLKPETAETEADRKGLIERAKSLTERLQKTLETLKDFDSPEGPADELQDLRKDTKTNVRVLLKGFFDEDESAMAEIEKQLELRPSENERRLAAFFYTQANPRAKKVGEALDKFFASKEYKTLKAGFVAALKKHGETGATAKIFAETEFAKLAAMKTPEERLKHADVLVGVINDQALCATNTISYPPSCVSVGAEALSSSAKELKGESKFESENLRTGKFLLQMKFMLLHFNENDLSYALPSYALVSLFRRGELYKRLGMRDEEFVKMVSFNGQGGYLNFAKSETSDDFQINGKRLSAGTDALGLRQAILQEMQEIARELVPAFNASIGYEKGLDESAESQSSGLTEYRKCGLRVNTHTGAVESELPASESVNQVGHVLYQFNKQEGEEIKRKHLVNQRMVFGPESGDKEAEPLDLASVSGSKDVPEGYPLQQLLKQIEGRLWELQPEITHLKSFKHVTADEQKEIEAKLKVLGEIIKQLGEVGKEHDRIHRLLRQKQTSHWGFLQKGKIDRLIAENGDLYEQCNALRGKINDVLMWLASYAGNFRLNEGVNPEKFPRLVAHVREHCVVGLKERLQPLIDEFARLQKAYRDIDKQYSSLFDEEITSDRIADCKARRNLGYASLKKIENYNCLGYTSLESLLRR